MNGIFTSISPGAYIAILCVIGGAGSVSSAKAVTVVDTLFNIVEWLWIASLMPVQFSPARGEYSGAIWHFSPTMAYREGHGGMTIPARTPRVPILMYHSISYCDNPLFRRFTVTPERLEEHLDYLSTHGYTPLTVSDYIQRVAGEGQLPPRPVVLTFDDGYADFYTAALPLLRKYHATATLYIVTGYVGSTSGWMQREGEADRALLNWSQIREIASSAVECGAHTHTHRPLDALAPAECRQEIELSQRLLGENVDAPRSFAYPFGYYSRAVHSLVRKVGFTSACAVRYAQSSRYDDRFALSRLIVTADTDLPSFEKLLLSGGRGMEAACLRLRYAAGERVRQGRQMLLRHV